MFAAGCAICGTDLVEHRRSVERRRPPDVSLPRIDPHVALVAITVVALVLSPPIALLCAGIGAYHREKEGLTAQRNLLLVLAAVSVAFMFSPELRFGLLWTLYG
jgi:hypothetical protein